MHQAFRKYDTSFAMIPSLDNTLDSRSIRSLGAAHDQKGTFDPDASLLVRARGYAELPSEEAVRLAAHVTAGRCAGPECFEVTTGA